MVTSYRIANGDVSAEVEVCRMGERSDTHLSDCDGSGVLWQRDNCQGINRREAVELINQITSLQELLEAVLEKLPTKSERV
jgi:hypothetical protein